MRSTSASELAARPPRSVYFGGGTPSLHECRPGRGAAGAHRRAARPRTRCRGHAGGQPGADELGDLAGFRRPASTGSRSGPSRWTTASFGGWAGGTGRPTSWPRSTAARAAGIGSLSLDVLTDVPGQTLDSWRATLEAVLTLEPDHLSVYTLTLDDPEAEGLTGPDGDHLPVSRGARAWRDRAVARAVRRARGRDGAAHRRAGAAAGLRRYEVANLARPGAESRHNLLYWRRRPYLALGPGAHASDGAPAAKLERGPARRLHRGA